MVRLVLTSLVLAASFALAAAPPRDKGTVTMSKPRNLKVLPSDISQADLIQLMARYTQALGVTCEFCHSETSQGINFSADESPQKETARVMIGMLSDINTKYLAQVSDRRYAVELTCGNCHQGQTMPPPYESNP